MKEVLTKFCANKDNRSLLLMCFSLFSFFLFLNVATPEYLDDFLYKYRFVNGLADTDYPIKTIKDILLSQIEHYMMFNGRSVVHFLVQLFTAILGKPLFNVFNAVAIVAFFYLLSRITVEKINSVHFLIVSMVSILLLPSFSDCFVWMTGSINYLWSGLAVLFYLYVLNQFKDKDISWKYFAIGVLALFSGWTHEGISFPLALSSLFYILFLIRKGFARQLSR